VRRRLGWLRDLGGDVDLETGLVCSCCMEAGTCQDMNADETPNPVAGSVIMCRACHALLSYNTSDIF
jgi:hypothetical protein